MTALDYLDRCQKDAKRQEPKPSRYEDRPEDGRNVRKVRRIWRERRDEKDAS